MTIQSLLDQFYADIILVNRMSEMTAQTYRISAQEFLEWLVQQKIKLSQVTVQNLVYFLMSRKTQGNSELTLAKDISALRAFGEYLVRKNYWHENLALLLDRPKAGRHLPKVLSVEQTDELLSSIDTSEPLGVRDDALFELIYSCGLRISEACSLKVENLHFAEHFILVHGKGDKERIIPFGSAAEEKVEQEKKPWGSIAFDSEPPEAQPVRISIANPRGLVDENDISQPAIWTEKYGRGIRLSD